MIKFIYDFYPEFFYSKVVSSEIIDISGIDSSSILNYVDIDIDVEVPSSYRPQLASFNNQLFIFGETHEDIVYGSALIKNRETNFFELITFESSDIVKRREEFYGSDADREACEIALNPHIEEGYKPVPLKEDLMSDISNVALFVEDYIRSYTPNSVKCPLLYGHTGISKSAIVKSVVASLDEESLSEGGWGYRVVDIKIGFFDKNDILGFVDKVEFEGFDAWTDSPNRELLICTDNFVRACRDYLKNNANLQNTNKTLYEKLKHFAKTPVMFFDELNRASKNMMDIVMRIVNSSTINAYKMELAPKVAAINLTDEKNQELIQYLVTEIGDIAAGAGRFIRIPVSPDDFSVITASYNYILSKSKTDTQKILSEIYSDSKSSGGYTYFYNPDIVDNTGKFPTLRGWEFTAKYLDSVLPNGVIDLDVIEACLGKNIIDYFTDVCEKLGYKVNRSDNTDDFLSACIAAGLPTAMFGKCGVAKTAKIMSVAKQGDYITEVVDLSVEEKTTMRGNPFKNDFIQTVFGKIDGLEDFSLFADKYKIPKFTTAHTPYKPILDKVLEAKKTGKKLLFILDECNRSNPIVQSAIFDIISEKKFKGVDLSDVDFSVIASGNWDPAGEQYNVGAIDAAVKHRFASKFIDKVTRKDYDSFKSYLKREDIYGYKFLLLLEEYSGGAEKILEILNTDASVYDVDSAFLAKIFTFREITTLGELLKQNDYAAIGSNHFSISETVSVLSNPLYMFNTKKMRHYKTDINDEIAGILGVNSGTMMQYAEFLKLVVKYINSNSNSKLIDKLLVKILNDEQVIFGQIKKYVFNNIPKEIATFCYDSIEHYIQQKAEEIAKNNTATRVLVSDKEASKNALYSLLSKVSAHGDVRFKELLFAKMVAELEESDDIVDFSIIENVINEYNNSGWGSMDAISDAEISGFVSKFPSKISNYVAKRVKIKIGKNINFVEDIIDTFKIGIPIEAGEENTIEGATIISDEICDKINEFFGGMVVLTKQFNDYSKLDYCLGYTSLSRYSLGKERLSKQVDDNDLDESFILEYRTAGSKNKPKTADSSAPKKTTSRRKKASAKVDKVDSTANTNVAPISTEGDDFLVLPNLFKICALTEYESDVIRVNSAPVLEFDSDCYSVQDLKEIDEDTIQYKLVPKSPTIAIEFEITAKRQIIYLKNDSLELGDTAYESIKVPIESLPKINPDIYSHCIATQTEIQMRKDELGIDVVASDFEELLDCASKLNNVTSNVPVRITQPEIVLIKKYLGFIFSVK